jgi:serine/threonine-protein kinase
MPGDPSIVETENISATAVGNVVVSAWRGSKAADIAACRELALALIARYGKIGHLTFLDPTSPQGFDRENSNESTKEQDPHTAGTALVICGTGLNATVARTVARGIQLMSGARAPWKVFNEDVDAAVEWLGQHMATTSQPYDAAAVTEAAGEMLAFLVGGRGRGPLGAAKASSTSEAVTVTAHKAKEPRESGERFPQQLGRYTLIERLGAGGMAEVYLATAESTHGFQKRLVIKRIHRHLADQPSFVEMFSREARVAAKLENTHVVQIFDAGEDGGVPYIAMEYVDGITARDALRRFNAADRLVPIEVATTIIADAARGLDYAHAFALPDGTPAPVIHRDVSLDNLVVAKDGTTKLLDFGIAKTTDPGLVTATGVVKGKIPFMSPEQVQAQPLDGRADLYSLGCALHLLLTTKPPFEGNEVALMRDILEKTPELASAIRTEVPPELDRVVAALLEKNREKRPATGLEVARKLAEIRPPNRDAVAAFVAEARALDKMSPELATPLRTAASRPSAQRRRRVWGPVSLAVAATLLLAGAIAALMLLR